MIAVADASPVNYLVLIDQSHLLPALYGRVFMPLAVATELNRAGTPEPVRWWITDRPEWLEVRRVKRMSSDMPSFLDPGEREAIALSQEINADVLRIDEWDGREEALRAPDKGRGYFTGSGERSREVFGGLADGNLTAARNQFSRERQTDSVLPPAGRRITVRSGRRGLDFCPTAGSVRAVCRHDTHATGL